MICLKNLLYKKVVGKISGIGKQPSYPTQKYLAVSENWVKIAWVQLMRELGFPEKDQ